MLQLDLNTGLALKSIQQRFHVGDLLLYLLVAQGHILVFHNPPFGHIAKIKICIRGHIVQLNVAHKLIMVEHTGHLLKQTILVL